jgi:hypothetical protein
LSLQTGNQRLTVTHHIEEKKLKFKAMTRVPQNSGKIR